MKRKNNFPALILFLCGFLAGNLLPNVLWKIKWQQKTMASVYFLSTFTTGQITGTEYLKEILKYRGSLFLVKCDLWIFSLRGTAGSSWNMVSGSLYRCSDVRINSAVWLCRRTDRSGSASSAVFILYPGFSLSDETGLGDVSRNLEKQGAVS